MKKLINFLSLILLVFFTVAAIERIIWSNTKYALLTNDIRIDTSIQDWSINNRCFSGGWEITEYKDRIKYRCGVWFPTAISFIDFKDKRQ